MRRNTTSLLVLVSLVVGVFAFNAGADTTERGGSSIGERVIALEESAERQHRAIEALRRDNVRQQNQIEKLLQARTQANGKIARLLRKAEKLNENGVYGGPVDNGQIELGGDPSECAGDIAEWNSTGSSLGCVPGTP